MTEIQIPYNFTPYPHQIPVYNCLPDGYKRGFTIWHRRAGKDKTFMNILARETTKRKGTYFYILPYYKQARMIIWEGIDNDGFRFIDHIPPELVSRRENQQMVLETKTGCTIRFLGSDNIDSIVGTNPVGVLFSEYSLHKPQAWNYLRPILAQNNGWALFNGTPRGKNHAHKLYTAALKSDDWFTELLTVNDTFKPSGERIVTDEAIEDERQSGMPPELIEQEFYCSFDAGMVGSFYADLIKRLANADPPQITSVPYEPNLPVSTAWDLGMNDDTFIWFFQQYRDELRLINCYANRGKPLPYYIQVCNSFGYNFDYHIMPHDINVREMVSGKMRIDVFRNQRGFERIRVAKKLPWEEGKNAVRQLLPRCWFDEKKTAEGLECLRNHHAEFDVKHNVFRKNPVHDEFSHGADGFRVLAIGIIPDKSKSQKDLMRQIHAIGYDYNPYEAHPDKRIHGEYHPFKQSDYYTNPNNYDPFSRTVTGNSLFQDWR